MYIHKEKQAKKYQRFTQVHL